MGKRSRKRPGGESDALLDAPRGASTRGGSTRAERDEARARRAGQARQRQDDGPAATAAPGRRPSSRRSPRGDRPPPPWGKFPLVELCVLIAIVMLIGGFLVAGRQGATMIVAGLALGSLGGLELSVREHFAGYRSHTTLLAGAVALIVGTLIAVIAGTIWLPLLAAIALVIFAACFVLFRRVFKKRSGGLAFR